MNIGASIGNIFRAVLVIGFIYAFMKWEFNGSQNDDARYFAEMACVDEIGARFDTSTIKVYAIKQNSSGYVVRATVTLARGNTAKVNCLTNTNGGVKEITIQER